MIASLIKRLYFVVLAVPIGFYLFWVGGWFFSLAVVIIFSLAASEYCNIFKQGLNQPARGIIVGGTAGLVLARFLPQYLNVEVILTLVIFCAMAYHLIRYERGRELSATDFTISLAGALYFGWLGGYLISLRMMTNGLGWTVLVMMTIWMVDIGGYCIGRPFGKHFLSPHLSPRKTWEGLGGGVLGGIIGALITIWVWKMLDPAGSLTVQYWNGITAGVCLGLLTPLGDLGESMVKRQFAVKDSSHLIMIPGHGGVWDRIDSWLWGIAIGYYLVLWVFI